MTAVHQAGRTSHTPRGRSHPPSTGGVAAPRGVWSGTCGVRPIAITRHEETVAFLLSRERMEAIVETLELLSNPDALKAIETARRAKGRYYPLAALDDAK